MKGKPSSSQWSDFAPICCHVWSGKRGFPPPTRRSGSDPDTPLRSLPGTGRYFISPPPLLLPSPSLILLSHLLPWQAGLLTSLVGSGTLKKNSNTVVAKAIGGQVVVVDHDGQFKVPLLAPPPLAHLLHPLSFFSSPHANTNPRKPPGSPRSHPRIPRIIHLPKNSGSLKP